ncbi:DUF2637 domain-containing protein [Nocardiopsis lambiniae]|uniref:DUF2637 domain-containing protein n=1 Tax=Nocardiopsis lambiniae TaxID=3075539 RepID=A0ABU2M7R9_9ACTN|nr:DUF2637 domain-containing protein [Nocardiopsis sp. DSM 44743]MDT0328286.1 DUF2637 domain-containing protein [Nocardiopsis sp. DSM 44743]
MGLIALCALVISYNGVFRLAEHGGHEGHPLAHVFPVMYTLLLIMACWVSYLLREAPPRRRSWIDLGLIPLLVLFAAVIMVLNNLELIERIPQRVASVIVAVAPLVALLIALLLWMAVRAHLRRRRTGGSRPGPANDRTMVLHGRAVMPDDRDAEDTDEGPSLEERLLAFGGGFEPRTDPESQAPDTRVLPETEMPEPEPPGSPDPGPEPSAIRTGSSAPTPVAAPTEDEDEGPEASVPTVPLPRRSRSGDNPIKQAADHPPLAPIASAEPEPEPEPEPAPVAVSAMPEAPEEVDEGFEHDPLPGDPVTDEAEAPVITAAAASPKDEEPVGPSAAETTETTETADEGPAPEAWEPGETDGTALPGHGDALGSEAALDEGPSPDALWEPPTDDDTGAWARTDYVPPVWTPPADDDSTVDAPVEVPAPALDHDTGPAVRAAFRIPDDPMAASRSALSDDLPDDSPVWTPPVAEVRPAGPVPEPAEDGPRPGRPAWTMPSGPSGADPDDTAAPSARPARPADSAPAETAPIAPEGPASPWDHDGRNTSEAHPRSGGTRAAEHTGPATPEEPVEPVDPIHSARAEDAGGTGDADEDTPTGSGRTRRTAFVAPAVPPGAARPREDDAEPDRDPVPEPVEDRRSRRPSPSPTPWAPAEPEAVTERLRRTPVEKRPMVLKPPRPPMPDFSSGPPSRRVRSEPLRPDE